jgi:tetratricopeptide (TPR) repeat protein
MEQALDILDALPDSASVLEQRFQIRVELRLVLIRLVEPHRLLEHLQKAAASADQLRDDSKRGQVYAYMTNVHSNLGELDKAVAAGVRALEIAERLGDLRLRIGTRTQLEVAHYFSGEYERVIELATDNLAAVPSDRIYDQVYFLGGLPSAIHDRMYMSMSLAQLGRFAAASELGGEAIRLAEPMQPFFIASANRGMGIVHILQGDWVMARACFERVITVLRTGGVFQLLAGAVASSAWTLAQLGDVPAALDRIGDGEQLSERQVAMGAPGFVGWVYHALGRASTQLQRLDDACGFAKRSIELTANQPGWIAWALHLLGDIATHPERFDAASGEDYYRQSLALAEPRGMRPLIAHCHLGLGRLYQKTGKHDQSREHLRTATTMYREMDMRSWLDQAGQS